MSKTKTFDFAKLAEEVRQAEEQKRLEDQATKLLLRFGIKADGRPRSERAASVRTLYHHNGARV